MLAEHNEVGMHFNCRDLQRVSAEMGNTNRSESDHDNDFVSRRVLTVKTDFIVRCH